MFSKERFDEEFAKTGLKKRFVSDSMGLAYDHFVKLTNGDLDWRISEVDSICKLLRWNRKKKDSIFFAADVACKSTVPQEA